MRNPYTVLVICVTIVIFTCMGLTAWMHNDCIDHGRNWNSVTAACE